MAFYHVPKQQQGQYRYDPVGRHNGPARLFSHAGEDGIGRYTLAQLGKSLIEAGKLSPPLLNLFQQVEANRHSFDEAWRLLTTLLVDLEIFQSDWFNWDLPPSEQFDSRFVRSRRAMTEVLLAAKRASSNSTQPAEAHSSFYETLELQGRSRPVTAKIHQREGGLSDREFARQRLAGQNPMVVRQIQPADQPRLQAWSELPCTLATGEAVDLTAAAIADRLFVADYPLLPALTPAELQPGRYVGSPIALFCRSETGLEPILIQLEPGNVQLPSRLSGHRGSETDAWMRAKLFVQVADVTYHELVTHLCDTHLGMEAFAIATPRQLPINHPVSRLLRPHFQFLLAINTRGNEILLSKGAAVDHLMAPTREASLEVINQAYRSRPFATLALPTHLKQCGVASDSLPDFPYRDDALLLWDAIARYVANFLQPYYPEDNAVQQDPYLQAWAAELGEPLSQRSLDDFPQVPPWLPKEIADLAGLTLNERPDYSRVPGFPAELCSLQQIIDIATQIIFTCGPQHAAVNFSQFDYVGYTPNAPMSAYCRPEVCTSLAQLLPPVSQDLGQMELTFALSGVRWGKLGSSELMGFADRGDRQVLQQFQTDLVAIEQKISDRNRQRLLDTGVDYPYLLPSRIPNSINI